MGPVVYCQANSARDNFHHHYPRCTGSPDFQLPWDFPRSNGYNTETAGHYTGHGCQPASELSNRRKDTHIPGVANPPIPYFLPSMICANHREMRLSVIVPRVISPDFTSIDIVSPFPRNHSQGQHRHTTSRRSQYTMRTLFTPTWHTGNLLLIYPDSSVSTGVSSSESGAARSRDAPIFPLSEVTSIF